MAYLYIVFNQQRKFWMLDLQVSKCIAFHRNKHLQIKCFPKIISSSSHAPLRQIVCGSSWFRIETRWSALVSPWWIVSPNSHTAILATITRSCKSQAQAFMCVITSLAARLRFFCISVYFLDSVLPYNLFYCFDFVCNYHKCK